MTHPVNQYQAQTPSNAAVKHQLPGTIELLKHAWAMYKSRAKSIIASMLVPLVLTGIFGLIIGGLIVGSGYQGDMGDVAMAGWVVVAVLVLAVIFLILYVLLGIAAFLVVDPLTHRTFRQAVKESPKYFWGYLCVALLFTFVVLGGMMLLFIPGLVFCIWYIFSFYTRLYEGEKGVAALKKSHHYVRGYFWPVLGRILASTLLLYIPYYILITLSGAIDVMAAQVILWILSWLFASFILQPILICFSVLLYATLKQVKATEPFVPSSKGNTGIIVVAILFPVLLIGSTLAVGLLSGTREKARDALRLSHVQSIQTALELYRAEQGFYPIEPTSIVLGEDMNDILTNQGFEDDAQLAGTIIYMSHVPREPYLRKDWLDASETNDYTYSSADGQTYQITFQLEGSIGADTPSKEDDLSGWVMTTPDGMTKADY